MTTSTSTSSISNKNKYLKLHHDTWIFSRRVPKVLKHFYPNKTHITKSLETSSVTAARLHRDRINGQLAAKALGSFSSDRMQFKNYLERVALYTGALKDDICSLDYDDVLPRNPIAKAAYRQEIHGDTAHLFGVTLKETLGNLLNHKTNMSGDNISKLKNSMNRFLIYLSMDDIALNVIHKKQVVEYIQYLANEYSHGTITAHLSRLKSIWIHAYHMGDIKDKTSPFCDHQLSQYKGTPSKPKQLFNKTELHKVLNDCPSGLKDLVRLGLYSGARISELCAADVEDVDGVKCLVIRKGKTASAARFIPVAPQVADIALPLSLDSKAAGRLFSRFKMADVTTDSTRSFHSLRAHFITASQRANLPEFDVANVVGHQTGATMSFGHYARPDIKRLYEAVRVTADQIDSEWLS
jgi:integrase/recombinase XerC